MLKVIRRAISGLCVIPRDRACVLSHESIIAINNLLSPSIAALLREHAAKEHTTPEVIIKEAVSAYLGITA